MPQSTRGEVEASLANAIIQFEKEHLGRGPAEARAFIIEDMILVRLRGVLTPAEMSLAQTAEGHSLIKQVRRQLLEGSRSLLEAIVQEKTGSQIKSCILTSASGMASGSSSSRWQRIWKSDSVGTNKSVNSRSRSP